MNFWGFQFFFFTLYKCIRGTNIVRENIKSILHKSYGWEVKIEYVLMWKKTYNVEWFMTYPLCSRVVSRGLEWLIWKKVEMAKAAACLLFSTSQPQLLYEEHYVCSARTTFVPCVRLCDVKKKNEKHQKCHRKIIHALTTNDLMIWHFFDSMLSFLSLQT